jgi:hypothetical protein
MVKEKVLLLSMALIILNLGFMYGSSSSLAQGENPHFFIRIDDQGKEILTLKQTMTINQLKVLMIKRSGLIFICPLDEQVEFYKEYYTVCKQLRAAKKLSEDSKK